MKDGAEDAAIHVSYHHLFWISGKLAGEGGAGDQRDLWGNIGRFSLCQCFPNFDLYK